jgi:CRP-like cAMP-binding protein
MSSANDLLLRALLLRDDVTEVERVAVAALPFTHRSFDRGTTIIHAGSMPTESCIMVSGMTARSVHTRDGKRQITAVHTPGDFIDLHGFLLKVMDHDVIALDNVEVGFVPHSSLTPVTQNFPHLTRLFWLLTLIDAAIHRAWLTCVGRKSPAQHIAHLICELYVRLLAIELATDNKFDFSVSQTVLSDMLALSLVHVNRSLQEVRALKLLHWSGQAVEIPDFDRLAGFADFDPAYLNLSKLPR